MPSTAPPPPSDRSFPPSGPTTPEHASPSHPGRDAPPLRADNAPADQAAGSRRLLLVGTSAGALVAVVGAAVAVIVATR